MPRAVDTSYVLSRRDISRYDTHTCGTHTHTHSPYLVFSHTHHSHAHAHAHTHAHIHTCNTNTHTRTHKYTHPHHKVHFPMQHVIRKRNEAVLVVLTHPA